MTVGEITRIVIPVVPRDFQGGAVCKLRTEIAQDGTYAAVAVTIPSGRQPVPGDVLSIRPFTMATDDHTQLYINAPAPAGDSYPVGPKLTLINAPSTIPDKSFGGDGVSPYFSTGINLLTNGGAYLQNSAFMFAWSLTDQSAATATDMGNSTAARVIGRNGVLGTYNANAANWTFPNVNTAASYGWTRRSATEQVPFRNGEVVDTHTQASSAVPSANLLIGQRGSSTFSARQFAEIAAGGSLPTDGDIANFGCIIFDWILEVGVFS